ncbi:MAG: DUF3515 family protein [Actinophytocola sp.]|nr:DUF3515 family protein [Actinophytocola sp.]
MLAALLGVALAVTVAVIGLTGKSADTADPGQTPSPGPLALPDVGAPQSESTECASLLDALPDTLRSGDDELRRRELMSPAPKGAAGWGDENPVVLRCGLDRPAELKKTSPLRVVNKVQWLPIEGQGSTTWYAVDREVYIALTVPDDAGTGPLQRLSDTIASALEPTPPRP